MVNHMRHTRSQTANRRSHHALKGARLTLCPDCKSPMKSHMACLNCGRYKGKVVIDMAAKLQKKEKKTKAKAAEAR